MLDRVISPLGTTGVDGELARSLCAGTTCYLHSRLRSTWASWWCSYFTTVSFGCMFDVLRLYVLKVNHLLLRLPINNNVEVFILTLSLFIIAFSPLFRRLVIVVLVMALFIRSTWSWRRRIIIIGFPSWSPFVWILLALGLFLELLDLICVNSLILTFWSYIWIGTLLSSVVESIWLLIFLLLKTLLSFIIKFLFLAYSGIVQVLVLWSIHEIVLHNFCFFLFLAHFACNLCVVYTLKFFRHGRLRRFSFHSIFYIFLIMKSRLLLLGS